MSPPMIPRKVSSLFEELATISNPFEDGTNIRLGTQFRTEFTSQVLPWYVPAQSTAPENWRDKWDRLRTRFERLIDERDAVEGVLVQCRFPAFGHRPEVHPPQMRLNHTILASASLRQEPAALFGPDGADLEGAFTITGANGEPMLGKDGRSRALRFGLWRHFCIQPRNGARRDLGALPVPSLRDLSCEATSLLYELPGDIATKIWTNWRSGFSKSQNAGPSLWIDALFELAWRREPGTALHSRPFAWVDNCSVGLVGAGLFPRLPMNMISPSKSFIPEEGGYPQSFFSTIDDISRASVAAIDVILESGKIRVSSASGRRFRVGLSFPGERREYVRTIADGLGHRLGRQNVLYDKFHEAELARPDSDVYLPRLFQEQCELIVVFLCTEYTRKVWCGLEWRWIRQLLSTPDAARIMFVAFENLGPLPDLGILRGDGYLLIADRLPEAICELVLERLEQPIQ